MKVEKLEEYLSKMPPKAEVRLHDYCGLPVLFVVARQEDPDVVWLECELDTDLREEIHSRMNLALHENWDELDFYTELIEIGITVEIMRKYLGDEAAKCMDVYCKEHGLL